MDTMFYPSVDIEEGAQSLLQSPMYQCPFTSCEFETSFTSYLKTHIKNITETTNLSVINVISAPTKRVTCSSMSVRFIRKKINVSRIGTLMDWFKRMLWK